MQKGGFITEYDRYLAGTIADVITGGDVPAGTLITEEYLLDLEREAFVRLCGQKKTLERIQHMLKKGKPLRKLGNATSTLLTRERARHFI